MVVVLITLLFLGDLVLFHFDTLLCVSIVKKKVKVIYVLLLFFLKRTWKQYYMAFYAIYL